MAVNLSPVGGVAAQFFTNTGAVLTGGKLYTYAAGTTTPAATYTSSQGTTAWTNPVVLDAAGRVPSGGEIWLTDGIIYKFVLKDSNDVLIATYDNITGINSNSVSYTNQQEIVTATAGQTVFDLSISYQPATNSLSVFVDGVNQYGPGAQYSYVETDSNTVTFNNGLHVGAEVKFTTTQQQGAGAVDASQVTYDPPFTGSVATNVEDKLAESVSVKDFGAVGDGIADDTAAIQNALDSGALTISFGGANNNYLVSSALTVPSNVRLIATDAKITQSANAPVFSAQGTEVSHLSNIEINGIVFVGTQATVTSNYAIDIRWCDNLKVKNNTFEDILPVFCGEYAESYNDISINNIQNTIIIDDNEMVLTKNCAGFVAIFVRYAKNISICRNTLIGVSAAKPAGIEIFGGGCDPSGDGAPGNPLKCFNAVINDNILVNQVAGLQAAQSQNVTFTGNSLDNAGEALWACGEDILFSSNTIINNDDAIFQTQGICKNVTFDGNTVQLIAETTRVMYIGDVWNTEYNVGPISFINNVVRSEGFATGSSFADCGYIVIKNNTINNNRLYKLGKSAIFELESNTFTFDTFETTPPESYYLFQLQTYNNVLAGFSTTQVKTTIKNNKWIDLTGNWSSGSVINIYDPEISSEVLISGNVFQTKNTTNNINFLGSSATVTTTLNIEQNIFYGVVSLGSATAADYFVTCKNNLNSSGNQKLSPERVYGTELVNGQITVSSNTTTDLLTVSNFKTASCPVYVKVQVFAVSDASSANFADSYVGFAVYSPTYGGSVGTVSTETNSDFGGNPDPGTLSWSSGTLRYINGNYATYYRLRFDIKVFGSSPITCAFNPTLEG